MNKFDIKNSFEKLKEVDVLHKIEKSVDDESKSLVVIKCKRKRSFWEHFHFYSTLRNMYWNCETRAIAHNWDFYLLPMLRYLYQGKNNQYIQFRWLFWGINFNVK